MAPLVRIHVPGAIHAGPHTLTGAMAQRLGAVLRAKPGDELRLFQGDGREWDASVETVTRQGVRLLVGSVVRQEPAPAVTLEVWCGLVRAARFDWAVEKCTEAGADVVRPLLSARTARGEGSEARLERWQRIAVEAAEQCGRLFVPVVTRPAGLEQLLSLHHGTLVFGDREGMSAAEVARLLPSRGAAAVAVGPEGGFSDEERQGLRQAGGLPLRLGPYTLRSETAAVLATAALRQAVPD